MKTKFSQANSPFCIDFLYFKILEYFFFATTW